MRRFYGCSEPGTTPLHRLYCANTGDHFYTTSAVERDNAVAMFGYVSEGIACYVFGGAAADHAPVHRLLKRFGAAFDLNVILVGIQDFTSADKAQVAGSIAIARTIYAKVGLQIRGEQWFQITVAEAGPLETIDNWAKHLRSRRIGRCRIMLWTSLSCA